MKICAICGRIVLVAWGLPSYRIDLQSMFSHRFHRFSQMLCFWSSVNSVYSVGPPTPPVDLCKSVQSVGGLFSTLLQNRLAEDVLPQNSRNSQNRLAEYVLSQILTDGACLEFCEFCVFCGTSHAPVNLCKSVQSVGGLFRLRGVYPPTE